MAVGERRDPYLAFNFLVEIDRIIAGGFSEVSGLQVEVDLFEYQEGGLNEYVHKLAGATRYPSHLILKRGITDADAMWRWHQEIRQGIIQRRNLSVILVDSSQEELCRWNFRMACPIRWIGPELRGDGSSGG